MRYDDMELRIREQCRMVHSLLLGAGFNSVRHGGSSRLREIGTSSSQGQVA